MSEVNGSLTFQELQKICNDNVGYENDPSLVRVGLYIQAMRALLTMPLEETEHAGERASFDRAISERMLNAAMRWQAAQSRSTAGPLPTFQPACNWRDE